MFKKLEDHFKYPEGWIGRLVGKFMATENKTLNNWTIEQLKIRPGKNLLEVGYGPGYAMELIFNQYPHVYIEGLDISEVMREEASKRLSTEIGAGKVKLMVGDVSSFTLPNRYYHYIYTVNNFTLWEDQYSGLLNLYKSLIKGGRIVITMQPRQEDAKNNQEKVFAQEIYKGLKQVGFKKIRVNSKKMEPVNAVSVIAFRPK